MPNSYKPDFSKKLRILVTNDDGIYAPGIKIIEKIAKTLSDDVWVVAPEVEQSGAGHSLTINKPIRYRKVSPKRFCVSGTPTDCVLMAVGEIVKGRKIDLVLSGVNRGQNVAEDITHSGTVAGALEGTLCGIPSIALSQALDFSNPNPKVNWQTAETHAPGVIKKLLAGKWQKDTIFNLNFPDCHADKVKGIKVVASGKRDIPKQLVSVQDPDGRQYYWLHWSDDLIDQTRLDSDIRWLLEDYITITPISLDLSNYAMIKALKDGLED
ncbi:MAG: 5'/3'-nucleotidase SurE [Pseudomonadota bacterium]